MKITMTWLGHSCWAVEADGYRIVFDPYQPGSVPGLDPVCVNADEVICSHEHGDHNARECVTLRNDGRVSPFEETFVESYHDPANGTLRGTNRIAVLTCGGKKIIHFGDLGCMPEAEQLEVLKNADAVMVPIGGHYTMEPEDVKKLMDLLEPKVVLPMHYRSPAFGFDVIKTLQSYTDLCTDTVYYEGNTFVLDEDTRPQTAVLAYQGSELK